MFTFLTLMNSTKDGHIFRPLFGLDKLGISFGRVGDDFQVERATETCGRHHHLTVVVVEMVIFVERGTMEQMEDETGTERKTESWW